MNHLVNNQADVDLSLLRANKELLTEPVIFIRKWISEVTIKIRGVLFEYKLRL